MTVAELIAALRKYPPDCLVLTEDSGRMRGSWRAPQLEMFQVAPTNRRETRFVIFPDPKEREALIVG